MNRKHGRVLQLQGADLAAWLLKQLNVDAAQLTLLTIDTHVGPGLDLGNPVSWKAFRDIVELCGRSPDAELQPGESEIALFSAWAPFSINAVAWRSPYSDPLFESVDQADPAIWYGSPELPT